MIQGYQLSMSVKEYAAGVIRDDFIQTPDIVIQFPRYCLIGLSIARFHYRLINQILYLCRAVRLGCQNGEQGIQLLCVRKKFAAGNGLQIILIIGQVLGVDGSRRAEGLNNNYFINGRHTPLMIMVKGGTLTDESFEKLQQYMNDIKGEAGQHAFIVLETEATEARADFDQQEKPEIEVKDLASILQKDELFQEYMDNNRRKVQSAFQLPDLYVGYPPRLRPHHRGVGRDRHHQGLEVREEGGHELPFETGKGPLLLRPGQGHKGTPGRVRGGRGHRTGGGGLGLFPHGDGRAGADGAGTREGAVHAGAA